jgi:hypothetical protein
LSAILFLLLATQFSFISSKAAAQEPAPAAAPAADQPAVPPANEPAPPAAADDHAPANAPHHEHLGQKLPLWTVIPFVTLLLCIAILPLAAGHWWEHNSNKGIIVGILSAIVTVYMLTHGSHGLHEILDKVHEYVSFIILLAALYIIIGGIYIKG